MNPGSGLYDLSMTKKVCTFSTISIALIILTMVLPFDRIPVLSIVIKIMIILMLSYAIYMNILQTNKLRNANSNSDEVLHQLTANIICSYVFTLFLGLLALFVAKGIFA